MNRRMRSLLTTLGAGLLVVVGQAAATTLTTTTYNGWLADITGAATELNFNTVLYTNYNTPAGITLNSFGNPSLTFTFTGPNNGSYSLAGVQYAGIKSLEGGVGGGINVTMPGAGITAFLLSVKSTNSTPITLTLSDGESIPITSSIFGVSVSHPITSFLLSPSGQSQVVINDTYFGATSLTLDTNGGGTPPANSDAPEGRTIVMIGGGILTLLGARRKSLGRSLA